MQVLKPSRRTRCNDGSDASSSQYSGRVAHIDCDWYDPVKLCLERLTPWLSPGARVILDDYSDYGGATRATEEHVAAHPEFSGERDAGHRVLVYAPVTA